MRKAQKRTLKRLRHHEQIRGGVTIDYAATLLPE